MRAVLQRVDRARVTVDGATVGQIGAGIVALVSVEAGDGPSDLDWVRRKLSQLRIFPDQEARMNRSVVQAGGAILLVSQFTLHGDCRKGNRPSFSHAAAPQEARRLYLELAEALRADGIQVETGRFRADMRLELVNSGPVTLLLDSRKKF